MKEKDFLLYLIESIVSNKENITIEQKEDELGTLLTISVDKDDMWVIIWKGWNTINSIRTIMRVFGSKNDKKVNIKVLD